MSPFIHIQRCNKEGRELKLDLANGPKQKYPVLRIRKSAIISIDEVIGNEEICHLTTNVGLATFAKISPDALEKELEEDG